MGGGMNNEDYEDLVMMLGTRFLVDLKPILRFLFGNIMQETEIDFSGFPFTKVKEI